jgi:flagellar motor switch protein FliM
LGDILSQREIDELLKALGTGELNIEEMKTAKEEKKIRVHNFLRPTKFAKDHLRTLSYIHENYARLVTNYLTGYLRTAVQVEIATVESLPYSDFTNSISVSSAVILGVIDFNPLNGSILLDISPSLAFTIIDRILGGKGTLIEKMRGFSEIEMAIIERVIVQLTNLLREPWESIITIRPRLDRIDNNAQFAQLINPNEMVAIVTLSVKIGDVEGMMNLCLPHMVLEPIVPKLSTKIWFSAIEKEITEETKQTLAKRIESTEVAIKAVLGSNEITIRDFLSLQKGDVIPLDTGINGHVKVMVGNILKFYGKPGIKKNRVAIKISDVIREEET